MQQNKDQIVSLLKGLQLSRRHIDNIIERLNGHLVAIENAEKTLKGCLHRMGRKVGDPRLVFRTDESERSRRPRRFELSKQEYDRFLPRPQRLREHIMALEKEAKMDSRSLRQLLAG